MLIVRYAPLPALLLLLGFPGIVAATSGSGPLLPAPLGQGMCQARRFADGSVQAQIAVKNATCVTATTVLGPAADRAHGAPYTAGGFTCKVTAEGAGSPWAAAWGGTYYAYTCASGGAQAAFTWGRHYTYGSGGSGAGSQGTGTLTFTNTGHHLLPSALGQGMCQARSFADGSVQAQIAVYQTTCSTATAVLGPAADRAQGAAYAASGYTCRATAEGAGSSWAAAWGGTYYAYTCASGGAQAAFTWGRHYIYGSGGSGAGSQSTGTLTFTNTGHHLLPSALGQGMCQARSFADGSVQAQIAVYQTTCAVASGTLGPAADQAKGGPYLVGGFTCKATVEGAGSPWAGAWSGTYYAYSCAHGNAQAAFNWGSHYTY